MEDERVERKDEAVDPLSSLLESDDHSQQGVEEDDYQKDGWVRQEDQAGHYEVGLAEVPLLQDIGCYQVFQGYLSPFRILVFHWFFFLGS